MILSVKNQVDPDLVGSNYFYFYLIRIRSTDSFLNAVNFEWIYIYIVRILHNYVEVNNLIVLIIFFTYKSKYFWYVSKNLFHPDRDSVHFKYENLGAHIKKFSRKVRGTRQGSAFPLGGLHAPKKKKETSFCMIQRCLGHHSAWLSAVPVSIQHDSALFWIAFTHDSALYWTAFSMTQRSAWFSAV